MILFSSAILTYLLIFGENEDIPRISFVFSFIMQSNALLVMSDAGLDGPNHRMGGVI